VKILADKGEIATKAGKLDVSILLFEDVTVVLVMALLSSLAAAGSLSPVDIGFETLKVAFFVAVVAAAAAGSSKYVLPRFLRYASQNQHAFLVHGLAWLFLFTVIAEQFGLSLEVGAFFAGVSIAQLPYSNELYGRVKPLTDFFLAVFFISLGLSLTTSDLLQYAWVAAGFSVAVVVFKFVLYYGLTSRLGFARYDSFKASVNMTQTSTFSIVYAAVALESGLLGSAVVGLITIVALVTMGFSSYLIYYGDTVYSAVFHEERSYKQESQNGSAAIVVGYNQAVESVLDDLAEAFDDVSVVDRRPEVVSEIGSREEVSVEFADFGHREVREDLGIGEADLVVGFSRNRDLDLEMLEETSEVCDVVVEAESEDEAERLREAGARYVFLEKPAAAERIQERLDDLGVVER